MSTLGHPSLPGDRDTVGGDGSALTENDQRGLSLALQQAQISYHQGGIPIGAALVQSLPNPTEPRDPQASGVDEGGDGGSSSSSEQVLQNVLGIGHNCRIQKGSAILHGEMARWRRWRTRVD